MKKLISKSLIFIAFLIVGASCTKELTDDIFSFEESFFDLQSSVDNDEIELEDNANFGLSIIEGPIASEYRLTFSSNLDGVFLFEGNSFSPGQSVSVESGNFNITYIPESEGIHNVSFTVVNRNDNPLSDTEEFSINVGRVSELNNDFVLQILLSEDEILVEETTTITINIIEGNDVSDDTSYNVSFGSSSMGVYTFGDQEFNTEGVVLIENNQIVLEFTPEGDGEHDLNFSVVNTIEGSESVCDSAILNVVAVDPEPILIEEIRIAPEQVSLIVEDTQQLTVSFIPEDPSNTVIDWESSDPNIATVDENGLITAIAVSNEPVSITAISTDGSEVRSSINITITEPIGDLNDENNIISFTYVGVDGIIALGNNTVTLSVPFGTSLTTNEPEIEVSEGASITPTGIQDFTVPFIYEVEAENGDQQEWVVTITELEDTRSGDNFIANFVIPGRVPNSNSVNSNENTFSIDVEFGTPLTSVTPEISVSPGAVIEIDGPQDFTSPVEYTVTAENGDERVWTLIVIEQEDTRNTETDITSFVIDDQVGQLDDVNHTVTIEVPFGTDLGNLMPDIELSPGATIFSITDSVGSATSMVFVYRILAENEEDTQDWLVRITIANRPPVANVEFDPTDGTTNTLFTFNGSGSTDPDGDDLTYSWRFEGVEFSAEEEVTRTFDIADDHEIQLVVTDENGVTNARTVVVFVADPPFIPVESIEIIAPQIPANTLRRLQVGEQVQLEVIILPENATNQNVIWSVGNGGSNTGVATVSSTGLVRGISTAEIVSVFNASQIIRATAEENEFITDFVDFRIEETVSVENVVPATSIEITRFPNSNFLNVDDEFTFDVTVIPSNATESVIWTTTDNGIVSIDSETGEAAWQSDGTVTITVTIGELEDSIEIEAEQDNSDDDETPG